MRYNFDEIIDRKNTSAYKTDLCKFYFGSEDLLPMWVADMDFKTPDFILDAIKQRCNHPIFGYTVRDEHYFDPIIKWIKNKHNWQVKKEWLGFIPGVVPALATSVLAFSDEGDKVIVQPPIYPPFFSVVKNNNRELVYNELLMKEGQYEINFDQLKIQVADPKVKLLLFCSPHNPGGRVWRIEELIKLVDLCYENDVLIISDEIHADLVLPGYKHVPIASISERAEQISVALMAPSKTFNMAGLGSSFYIIPSKNLLKIFSKKVQALETQNGNLFAYVATRAAYENGKIWLEQMNKYVHENILYVDQYLKKHQPKIKVIMPQASFLIWLDFSELKLSDDTIQEILIKKAQLAINPGSSFGPGGEGFHRMNVGCSRKIVKEALERLSKVFQHI